MMKSTIDRLKRKIVSRLTDEVDIYYLDEKQQIDNKVVLLNYKDRAIIIDKSAREEYLLFVKSNNQYNWNNHYGLVFPTKEKAVEQAKRILKDDEMWLK